MTFLLASTSLFVLLKGVSLEILQNPLRLMHTSIIDYGHSLFANYRVYLSSLYGNGKEIPIVGILLIVLNCIFLIGYLLQKSQGLRKFYIIILISIIAVFIAILSLLKATIWHFYLAPLFGISIIVFGETIAAQKYGLIKVATVLWIILYVGQFLMYYPPKIDFFNNAREIERSTTVLTKRIKDVQSQKGYLKPNFFLIKVYTQGVETPTIEDLAFWLPLEQKLQLKFIQVNDKKNSFKGLNSDDYIYVVCQSFADKINISKDCLKPFDREFPRYKIDKVIYEKEPFTIYEALL